MSPPPGPRHGRGAQVPPVPDAAGATGAPAGPDVAGLAGLAREVDGLRRTVEPLRELPGRVDDLTRMTADMANAVAALTARRQAAACPSWLLLPADPDLAARVLDVLCGWLGVVYLRFPDSAGHLPECWIWHPDIVEELLWLMHAWAAAYQGSNASVALVGDWHDRQRPGVVRRIKAAAGACSFEKHQDRPGWDHLTGAPPDVPGVDAVASIAGWWGSRREQPAPEPTVRRPAHGTSNGGGRR